MMVVFKMIPKTEKMGAIITLILGSVVVFVLSLDIALVGPIQGGLPAPTLPDFSMIPKLALGSVSVALVALVQGAGISTAVPNPDGSKSSASRDFLGQGIGNLAGSFFQSMPTGGSLSRTGISTSAGAKSRWGGIFAGLFLALIILAFSGLVQYVPLAGYRRYVMRYRDGIDPGSVTRCQVDFQDLLGGHGRRRDYAGIGPVHPLAMDNLPGCGTIFVPLHLRLLQGIAGSTIDPQ
jgi:hypothetical protein